MPTNGRRNSLKGNAVVINNSTKLLLLLFLLKSIASFAVEANYANLFDEHESTFGVGANEVRLVDVVFPATQCAIAEKYACVFSKVFVFAVPRDIEKTSAWNHAGASYKVLAKKEKLIRGEVVEYRVIRQEWKRNVTDYAYSKDYGVIAIKGNNAHEMMVLEKCGFAAISSAKGCRQD
jgi:hypothetical protein